MAEQRKYSEEDEDLPEIDLSSEDSNSPLATRQTMGAAVTPKFHIYIYIYIYIYRVHLRDRKWREHLCLVYF